MVHTIPDCGFAKSYIIEEDSGLIIVDVGSIGAAKEIEKYCTQQMNRALDDIRYIVATHFHIDHIGGIGTLLKKCSSETRVLFHHFVKEYLSGERKLSPMRNWITGLLPAMLASCNGIGNLSHVAFEDSAGIPLPVFDGHHRLSYEDRIQYLDVSRLPIYAIGFGNWDVIATPGHTEDSVSFYNGESRELICGDLILGDKNGSGYLNRFCWDEDIIQRTFQAISSILSPHTIYPGHGGIIRDDVNAFREVKTLADSEGGIK